MAEKLTSKEASKLRKIDRRALMGKASVAEVRQGMALRRKNEAHQRSLQSASANA